MNRRELCISILGMLCLGKLPKPKNNYMKLKPLSLCVGEGKLLSTIPQPVYCYEFKGCTTIPGPSYIIHETEEIKTSNLWNHSNVEDWL